ncbi:LacI family DNA-binding transcriptional regulator [Methylocapsa sp. S129]|uniref:LacI family DNA-binding transcriptional regulator n=1 Tax=Methylocapsa sp. S129 TaxID=1641869 RepID=UPI00131C3D62|nr:LacI family DNA-binding transcriptional regulator [Methylocapsa sp. S129]
MTGIRELARHLDISIGTVSRALNDKADVNPETRERVREAAARLGYSPNQSGRSLRRGKTDLVGVIVPTGQDQTLINPVFLSVLDGLRRRLSEQRLDLAIFLHGHGEELFGSLRRVTERGLVDGLIISETQHVDPRIDYLIERRQPFAAFGRSLSGGDHAWVDPDFAKAVESSIEILYGLGHRRIALMLPVGETNYLHLIFDAYLNAMQKRGLLLESGFVQRRAAAESGGYAAGEALLAIRERPTAILVSDAIQSLGLYRRLNDTGLQPGRDVSLIGILPEERAQILSPALATFQTDWTAIGVRLGEALISAMARPSLAPAERAKASSALGAVPAIQTIMPVALRAGESIGNAAPP